MFLAHKSDAHNFSDRGLPKALSTLVYPTHRTTCLPFGSSGGLSPLSHLSVPNISSYPHFPTIKLRLKCHKIAKFKKKKKIELWFNSLDIRGPRIKRYHHLTHRPCTKTMERTITARPAPYCFKACFWSQCCILLLATLEWGQCRDRWQQMERQKCPSRYEGLATRKFLLGIWASKQLNLWTFLSVYLCRPVSSCRCPRLLARHTHDPLSYNESVWPCLPSHMFPHMQ